MELADLAPIEELALELARLAGAEIERTLSTTLAIRYKGDDGGAGAWRDPVSEVDHRVEELIRLRIAERFPDHGIIGEELDRQPCAPDALVWVIDPIDGTANFVSGFPMFAASIGVLKDGWPVVGAVWCSTSHAMRAGVYHACSSGTLRFDQEALPQVDRTAVRRSLVGEPSPTAGDHPWDVRKTGSAAIECAFVAAGLLRAARFERPNVWDVAGGVPLALATGAAVLEAAGGSWGPFDGYGANPAEWRRPMILGDSDTVSLLAAASEAPQ